MTIAALRRSLRSGAHPRMRLPGGALVPVHFHLTEFGVVTKDFVDCGGTFRQERRATLQLWTADDDLDHRLSGERLLEIIEMGSGHFDADALEVQVEFQGERTIEVFGLTTDADGALLLTGTQTACLAQEACGIPLPMATVAGACAPGSGCC